MWPSPGSRAGTYGQDGLAGGVLGAGPPVPSHFWTGAGPGDVYQTAVNLVTGNCEHRRNE